MSNRDLYYNVIDKVYLGITETCISLYYFEINLISLNKLIGYAWQEHTMKQRIFQLGI